ncbi:hypothetical protein AQJ46_42625 [Streptomyces canus]|uniref:IclR-ED domain-containing protein n=1 Tax=Streptomyces canus TaxID=58343 RepID=A0A101RMY0_9ACTN|nr:hypothetical protein AQJ46_42625 [Streptomyces canus]
MRPGPYRRDRFLYSVGIRALLTGTSHPDSDRCVRAVRPYPDEASDALGETIHLAQPDGSDTVHLTAREAHEPLRTINRLGRQAPAHAETPGKALLTERADDELPPGETIHLAPPDGSDTVHLTAREAHEPLRTISRLGRRPRPTARQELRRPAELVDTS